MTINNKSSNYTIRIENEDVELVQKIAYDLGYRWGKKGSVGKMLTGLCHNELILLHNPTQSEYTIKKNKIK